jgi:glutathione S-transferase
LLLADSALDPSVEYPVPTEVGQYLAEKYGYRPGIRAEATARIVDVLNVLATRLKAERANGNRFLMGAEVTAVDFYWATFCAFLKSLPHE